ncbi:unnamed protein product [Gongylonema pulchrum]|uniref:Uncharacterized protein n=1 Tax=Gongylonema pulchrum TaxID=637853 RepID=A0A3P6RBC4_9BILA|nr:unnamed protein product [Gongylonema pulchrum]
MKPRYGSALLCIAIGAVLKHFLGILFTAVVLLVLIISAPFVLIVRYVHLALYRTEPISTPFIRHCDIWWPLRGNPARAVLTLEAALNVELYSVQMNNVLKLEESGRCSCFGIESSPQYTATAVVNVWDQK